MRRKITFIPLCVLLAATGYFIGVNNQNPQTQQVKDDVNSFPLLAKRIFQEDPNDTFVNFAFLRSNIKNYMTQNSLKGSVYFEYLPTGTSVRVDDNSEEAAASLMKIPAVMELYRAAELGRVDLNKNIPLKQEWLDSRYGNLYTKGAGYTLTLKEATKLALQESDNTAIAMIIASSRDLLLPTENVLTFLDVDFSRPDDDTLTISARSYASFLKCLYFSCYISPENSTEILSYLTSTIFNNRLRAGVPNDIVVAHKIGTFSDTTMSDCGIVYQPKRNYVICVMLEVPDNEQGNAHIATISKTAYEFVKAQ